MEGADVLTKDEDGTFYFSRSLHAAHQSAEYRLRTWSLLSPIYSLFLQAKYSMQDIPKLARPHLEISYKISKYIIYPDSSSLFNTENSPDQNFQSHIDILRLQHHRYHFIK